MFVGIDAHAVAYRGYYAFKDKQLRNSKGITTSAAYYFYVLWKDIRKRLMPTYALIAFDSPKPTFRHRLLKQYKAQRPPTPDDVRIQLNLIRKLAEAMGISTYNREGYEADDILASAARKFKERGIKSVLVTMDKDIMSLVDEDIRVMDIATEDNEILDAEKVEKKFGVKPYQIPDYLVLVGDAADNIPGVKGIGEKRARELLVRFGSIEGILENINKLDRRIAGAILEEKERIIEFKRRIFSLDFEAFDGKIEDLKLRDPDKEKLIEILRELEFFTALSDIAEYPKLPEIKVYKGQSFTSVSFDGKFYFGNGKEIFVSDEVKVEQLEGKFCINSKEIYKVLPDTVNLYDLSVGDYLILPEIEEMEKDRHNLESLALKYKAWKPVPPTGAFSAHLAALIGETIIKTLREENLWEIYEKLEIPLIKVLAYMEKNGVLISLECLENLGRELEEKIKQIEREIYTLAGMVFNLNSPKQLGIILFEKLKLPKIKRTKTGYSTDVEVLTELSKVHPLPAKILEYREIFKIKSTYVDGLKRYIGSDGRIHPTFSQTTTATGRLSCLNPNLQNIPARGILGKKVRECFVAPEGYKIVSFDYSQIELRILAHLSGDENLREIFYRNGDIHTETARALFGKEDISEDERRVAKTVNFGIIYGISPYGLSKSIGVDQETAKEIIRKYYERFPKVKIWHEEVIEFASKNGFVQTLLGRRRYIFADPKVNDEYRRIAINTPVQGSAADLIKKAMIEIYQIIKDKRSKMVLQVHDELVFEIHEDEMDIIPKIKEIMEGAIKLEVPVVVEFGIGENWAQAKG